MRVPASDALVRLGWNDRVAALVHAFQPVDAEPGRVARVDRGLVTVLTAEGAVRAASGREAVATGDWVLVGRLDDDPTVVAVLPRHSVFVRGDPMDGRAREEQVVAANVDTVFVVHALSNGPRVRRLERELVLAFESGAVPVVVLNKADVAEDRNAAVREVTRVAAGAGVLVTSAVTGEGLDRLRAHGCPNRTVALIGPSGVGKSTLVNRLVGSDVQATGDVRASDQRGRHTTAARELVALPGGGVVIDTPGLRAVSLWHADTGFGRAFADVESRAERCRFADCAHDAEPGCAVRAAVDRGELDAARLDHYRRLDAELDEIANRRPRSERPGARG